MDENAHARAPYPPGQWLPRASCWRLFFFSGGPGSLPAHYDTSVYQSTHNTGGAIMGADPATSVVNSYLQMWETPNVFVVGACNFPQNAGFNPTGTVGVLAYRAAEGILKFHKTGGSLV